MTFHCPHCGQKLEVETMYSGRGVPCPACGKEIFIPQRTAAEPAGAAEPEAPPEPPADSGEPSEGFAPESPPEPPAGASWRQDATRVRQMVQANVRRDDVTITQFMQKHGMEGGVLLDESQAGGSSGAAGEVLTAEQGRKYRLGGVVAQGGMGAILDARDVNLRRSVAMKVLLDPGEASQEDVLRFIEEAQVTSQLEHPGVVPIHELGIDGAGNVFYTMKFVHGVTLKKVLGQIREGDARTIQDYPLNRLLTVFQKVCDAMAFAHSKRVVHRDLKPENIMIGEYGEVQVMDWGLAKVLAQKEKRRILVKRPRHAPGSEGAEAPMAAARKPAGEGIDSVRKEKTGEILKTMAGSIMGTPGYMAPEQATGEVDTIDERTDIYALGAILYCILTLRPPIECDNLDELVKRVSSGTIQPPSLYNPRTQKKRAAARPSSRSPGTPPGDYVSPKGLAHCPGGRIPDALGAVAMKALSVKPEARYPTVRALQAEIEAYQSGFATRAEGASAWKLFRLFVKRHKGAAAAAVLVLAVVLVGSVLNWRERVKAEQALADFKAEQAKRQAERKKSAPALVDTAKAAIERKDFETAMTTLDAAVDYNPSLSEPYLIRSLLWIRAGDLRQALDNARQYAAKRPGNADAKRLAELCRQGVEVDKGAVAAAKGELVSMATQAGLSMLAAEFSQGENQQLEIYKAKLAKGWSTGMGGVHFLWKPGIGFFLEARGQKTGDLNALRGIPMAEVYISLCRTVSDLSGLRGAPLKKVRIEECPVADIGPLQGLPITNLCLFGTQVTDLNPLKGMPLESLNLARTPVRDLSPLPRTTVKNFILDNCPNLSDLKTLQGAKLTSLSIENTSVSDLGPLRGMSLQYLRMPLTKVRDLTPLQGMPLTTLIMNSSGEVYDLGPLRGMPLERLGISRTKVTDLSPLKGMPLKELDVAGTGVTDFTPLEGMNLERIQFIPAGITKGIEVLRPMTTLKKIQTGTQSSDYDSGLYPDQFWKKYDAGEFGKK